MDKEQVRQIVNEAVELFLEGGPGSGRYPAGSGKNPTPEDNVARAERASKKAEKTGKSDDYARASGRHTKAYLSLRDTDPEAAKKHYLKAEEHGVMAKSTQTMGFGVPRPKDVSIEAANLSAIALKTTNDDLDAREKAHTAAGDAHEKAAQHIRDEIAAKRLAANEELKARSHIMSAGFHWDVVKDTKKARKAEENVAAGRQTPEERPRRMTTYHIKNAIRFLARQRRDKFKKFGE